MRRWGWTMGMTALFVAGMASGHWLWRESGAKAAARAAVARGVRSGPCGGTRLREQGFPRFAGLASPPTAPADAPTHPETFLPDAAAFAHVLEQAGTPIEMASYSTNFSHATPSQAGNIALVARRLTGRVLPAGATFSYNRALGPFTAAGGYGWGRMFVGDRIVPSIGGGVCQVASTLYNAVLLSNLSVVERHPHGLTVPYLPPGRDATVADSAGIDFRFRNSSGGPLVLWASAVDRRLTVRIYGRTPPPHVEIHTQILATRPYRTETVRDRHLPPGTSRVVAPGQDGATSRTWVVVTTPQGSTRRDLGITTYRPSPRVILRGPTRSGGGGVQPSHPRSA